MPLQTMSVSSRVAHASNISILNSYFMSSHSGPLHASRLGCAATIFTDKDFDLSVCKMVGQPGICHKYSGAASCLCARTRTRSDVHAGIQITSGLIHTLWLPTDESSSGLVS